MQHIDALIEDFELFSDWEERYAYIIDLGRSLTPMDTGLKTDDNFVRGCTSQVWMIITTDKNNRLKLIADSDAIIVRGLIGILVKVYEGLSPEEATAVDIENLFVKLGLSEHLSPNRRNGFFAMAQKIKNYSGAVS